MNEPFFKDRERRLINRGGKIILDEWLPLSSGERFFFYVAVSRAARRLVLTYPAVDRTGKELVRSHYVEEVARVFSDLRELSEKDATVAGVPPGREFSSLTAADELRSFVAHHLSQPRGGGEEDSDGSSTFAALTYNELLGQGALEADHLFCQAHDARLSERAVHAFQQKEAYLTSVSELETFGRCPFRHFCQYRLQLKELPRYEFGPLEEGVLYHDLLATLYREIYLKSRESGAGGIESISPEDLRQKLALLVDEFINARYSRLFRTSRMEVRRRAIRAKIKDFLLKEIENERVNSTRPAYFELSFGQGKSQQKADRRSTEASLRIGAKGGPLARISGRMDRVDLFQEGDEKFGVVLDYKRSERITGSDLRRGTVLQSGIYMLALEELFGLKAAGAFYYSIFSARKRGVFAAEEEERIAGKGDVSRTDKTSYHEIRELMELNARQALEYVSRIMQGEIGIHPADRNECRTCPFSSVCRIRDRAEVAV